MKLKSCFKKIADIAEEKQTEKLKVDVYNLILQFVRKYHTHYHPHYQGGLEDLAGDLYTDFIVPKKHRDGSIFSELDRFSEEATGEYKGNKLATYVQRYVISRLIDRERKDKREGHYSEKYDEETGTASLDHIAKFLAKAAEGDFDPEEFEITPELLASTRDAFDELDFDQQQNFKYMYEEAKPDLNKKFRLFFEDLLKGIKTESGDPLKDVAASIGGLKGISQQVIKGFENPVIRVQFKEVESARDFANKIPEGYKYIKSFGSSVYVTKED